MSTYSTRVSSPNSIARTKLAAEVPASPTLAKHSSDRGFLFRLAAFGVAGVVGAGTVLALSVPVGILNDIKASPRQPTELVFERSPGPITLPSPAANTYVQPSVAMPTSPPQAVITGIPSPTMAPPAEVGLGSRPVLPSEGNPLVSTPPQEIRVPEAPPQAPPVQEAPATTVAEHLNRSLADGRIDSAEAKQVLALHDGTVQDFRRVADVYADSRTQGDARGVFDAFFVGNGVPAGAGAQHIVNQVTTAVNNQALGVPLRGKLPTGQMMSLEISVGRFVHVAPGTSPQFFLQTETQGTFGPFPIVTRAAS